MTKLAANLTMMFNEVDFLDRFASAAEAGFKGVEYLFPYDFDRDAIGEQLDKHGLTQVLFDMPAGDFPGGERGIAIQPERQGEFQDGVGLALEYAKPLGCGRLTVLAGLTPHGADPAVLEQTLIDNLKFAARQVEGTDIRVLLEPINTTDMPGFFVCHSDQGRSIVEATGSSSVRLQYDIYHMQIMEGNLARTIEANMDVIHHFQLADNPGRHEPGTGEINYEFLLPYIDSLGYDGWVGSEYVPAGDTVAGLGWSRKWL